jgi:hypothetical protein
MSGGDQDPDEVIERLDLSLRAAQETDDPAILDEIVEEIRAQIVPTTRAGFLWARGKGLQEWGKAQLTRVQLIREIEQLKIDRQRFLDAREEQRKELELKERAQTLAEANAAREFALRMEQERRAQLAVAVEILKELHAMGVHVDLQVVLGHLGAHQAAAYMIGDPSASPPDTGE